MTTSEVRLALVREADRILEEANLNKVGRPKTKGKSEDLMAFAVKTPCGGQPGWRR